MHNVVEHWDAAQPPGDAAPSHCPQLNPQLATSSGCNTECKVTINNIILILIIVIISIRVFLMLSLWEQGGGVVKQECNPSQPVESLESQFSATFLQIHSFHHHPPCPALVTLILWPPTPHGNVF